MADEHGTALGSAHARFLESLAERGRELRELTAALEPAPNDERLAERLRRRLHALYASAQLFQEDALLERISPLVARLDAARDGYRPVAADELASVRALCEALDPEAGELEIAERASAARLHAVERWSMPPLEPGERQHGLNDPPMLVTQTIAGGVIAPEVIAALLVASPEVESEVRAALPAEFCEVTSTAEAETALLVIEHVAPDLVMIETNMLREEAESFVRVMRDGRRAIVALVPELASEADAQLGRAWADAVLRLPLPRAGLLERLQRLAGRGARPQSALEQLQAGTVEEIARSVADEVRRGISGALRGGRGQRIDLGDKTELLAATWSAVARIRAHLSDRAEGRVNFDPVAHAGAPFSLALTDDEPAAPYVGLSESLEGRRIVIVDDDPSVVWFFAGLVREAGAIAVEARDGREALTLMRSRTPDLLVSDIVMPEIDGFALCRELKRDAALCHVPVVLLSWKEDFLQRMRELDAGAAGYLRKEAGTHQILSTLAEALRPRAALASLLAHGGEVQGRIDHVGVAALLRLVAEQRPNARLRVRDAWNLFEVDLREGTRLSVTRTAADGSFARGRPALLQLLGVDVGRFGVAHADGPLRAELGEPLERALHEGLAELGGLLDSLSDTWLMQVARVDVDDEVLRPLLAATPTALADLASRLRTGAAPSELLTFGVIGARELELQLRELARRGAIVHVWGRDGQDLALSAWRARAERPGELLHGGEHAARSSLPPPLPLSGEARDGSRSDRPSVRPRSSRPPPMPFRASRSGPPPPLRRSVRARAKGSSAPPLPSSRSPLPLPPGSAQDGRIGVEPAQSAAPPSASPSSPTETSSSSPPSSSRSTAIVPVSSRPPPPSARPHASSNGLRTTVTVVAVAALGFFAHRMIAPWIDAGSESSSRSTSTSTSTEPPARPPAPAVVPAAVSARATPAPEAVADPSAPGEQPTAEPSPAEPELSAKPQQTELEAIEVSPGYGRVLPFIDPNRGVDVNPGQGLFVVEYTGGGSAPSVRIAGRELGRAPVATALSPGRHELLLRRGGQTSFRYVVIRAGETRIVDGH
ncbi:MAG TPA: response regulator [Polyangiales bacterium]|nr:response regulator [Polyangiales bacterium]